MKSRTSRVTFRKAVLLLFIIVVAAEIASPRRAYADNFEPPADISHDLKSRSTWHALDDQKELARVAAEALRPEVFITPTPKVTADSSRFERPYLLELKKFGISNEGENAIETSKGINAALLHANSIGANRILFPSGIYLISATDPIVIDHQNTIIDFNGAHLKLKPNGLKKYSIVEIIDGAKNLRITNGTIQGDKEDHDFKTNRGSHEWGHGLVVHGGSELEIDHLTVSGVTGDGVSTRFTGARNREELVSKILHSVYPRDLESGGFSAAGGKIDNGETIRSIAPFDLAKSEGEFEFGYSTGYSGYPFIQDREYRAFFFDESQQFLESQRCLQFRKVQVPPAARFVHLEFNQSNVPDRPLHAGAGRKSFAGRISDYKGSVDVHFHHNKLVANRRLGMGYCGGRRWLIEENHFVQNGGVAPGYGIDLEDGWESMQDVVIRNNYFKENQRGDLVICAGTELLIEGNHFEGNVAVHGRPHNYTFRKNHFTGGHIGYTTRTGVAEIHDNYYENCTLSIRFDTAAVADGLRRDPGESVRTPPLKLRNETLRSVKKLTGTYVDFANSSFEDVKFVAGKETQLMLFKGGVVESCSALFEATGPPVLFQADFCQGELVEEGPGRSRLKPQNGNSK